MAQLQADVWMRAVSGRAGERPERPLPEGDSGVALAEAEQEVKPPRRFQVVLLNDDFTPMEFVVEVLMKIFGMGLDRATQVMLTVHTKGRGVCGVYPRDIAETKVHQVIELARTHQHPLMCVMEEV